MNARTTSPVWHFNGIARISRTYSLMTYASRGGNQAHQGAAESRCPVPAVAPSGTRRKAGNLPECAAFGISMLTMFTSRIAGTVLVAVSVAARGGTVRTGEMRHETAIIDLEQTDSARVELSMSAGDLIVKG